MARTITFNELRDLKDKLPDGSIHQIAAELDMTELFWWIQLQGRQ